MSFGKLLKQKMEERRIKQTELSEAVGIPKTTLSSMINRDNTRIDIEIFLKICKYLDCDPNEFAEEFSNSSPKKNTLPRHFAEKYGAIDSYGRDLVKTVLDKEYERCTAEVEFAQPGIRIPHSYYKVSAGRGFELAEDEAWEEIEIPDTPDARKADFALTIQGDSMEPVYYGGDIVLVRKQPAVDVGQIGIFVINGAGYIKKFGGDRLISLNDKYDDIIPAADDSVYCMGKVIGRAAAQTGNDG